MTCDTPSGTAEIKKSKRADISMTCGTPTQLLNIKKSKAGSHALARCWRLAHSPGAAVSLAAVRQRHEELN
jgi:hypothetical protein